MSPPNQLGGRFSWWRLRIAPPLGSFQCDASARRCALCIVVLSGDLLNPSEFVNLGYQPCRRGVRCREMPSSPALAMLRPDSAHAPPRRLGECIWLLDVSKQMRVGSPAWDHHDDQGDLRTAPKNSRTCQRRHEYESESLFGASRALKYSCHRNSLVPGH